MRALVTVLAAILVVAAGTACAGDDEPENGAAPVAIAGATEPAATEPAFTLTEPDAATDRSDTRPEPEANQSRWAQEVDAACRQWQERLDALERPSDAASLEAFLVEALPLIRNQIAAVTAVPPEDSRQADEAKLLVAGMRRVADALARYRTALAAGNATAAQTALAEAGAAGTETRERARALGVTACGGYAGG